MGDFTRKFLKRLRDEGFEPEVVDRTNHRQIYVDGVLISTQHGSGSSTMRWQEVQVRNIIHRLKRERKQKDLQHAER